MIEFLFYAAGFISGILAAILLVWIPEDVFDDGDYSKHVHRDFDRRQLGSADSDS